MNLLSMALTTTNLTKEEILEECPKRLFRRRGIVLLQKVFCDEWCEICWYRRIMFKRSFRRYKRTMKATEVL